MNHTGSELQAFGAPFTGNPSVSLSADSSLYTREPSKIQA
jgi:hypothetical protein